MTNSNHDQDRELQRDARAWSTFSGMKYTAALRLMKHPLAQGILGERLSARKLISVLSNNPVLSEPVWDTDDSGTDFETDERVTHLGDNGLWSAEEHPLRCSNEDDYIVVVLTAELLRAFSPTAEPQEDAYGYNLKHTAEEFFAQHLGDFSYVANGTAIWAAAALDLPLAATVPDGYTLNAKFWAGASSGRLRTPHPSKLGDHYPRAPPPATGVPVPRQLPGEVPRDRRSPRALERHRREG